MQKSRISEYFANLLLPNQVILLYVQILDVQEIQTARYKFLEFPLKMLWFSVNTAQVFRVVWVF